MCSNIRFFFFLANFATVFFFQVKVTDAQRAGFLIWILHCYTNKKEENIFPYYDVPIILFFIVFLKVKYNSLNTHIFGIVILIDLN